MPDPQSVDPNLSPTLQSESSQTIGELDHDIDTQGDINHSTPSLRRTIIVVIIVVCFTLIILWLGGQWQRGSLQQFVAAAGPAPAPIRSLEQSGGNTVLILEQVGSQSRIYIQRSGQNDWLLVSFPHPQPQRPTLATDGSSIAYVASDEKSIVVWKAVDGSYQAEFDDAKLAAANMNIVICPWTPAAIAPDNTRIAFFGCDDMRNESVLLWAGVMTNTVNIVESSRSSYIADRELQWLNTSQVLVTTPTGDDMVGTMVSTYDVQ